MKKLSLVFLFAALAHAQFTVPTYSAGMTTPPGYAVNLYNDFESGSNGDTITAVNINPHGTVCTWNITNGVGPLQKISTAQAWTLPNPVSVGGVNYSGTPSTRSFMYDPNGTTNESYAICNFTATPNVSFFEDYYTTASPASNNFPLSIVQGIASGGDDYVVTHWTGECGDVSHFGIHITATGTNPVCLSPNTHYWIEGLYCRTCSWNGGGYHYLLIFNPATSQLVGSIRAAVGFSVSADATEFDTGRHGADGSAGVGQWYNDNQILRMDGAFPLGVFTPVANAPTYDNGTGTYVNTVTVHASDLVPTTDLGTSTDGIQYCTDTAGTCTPGSTGTTHGTLTCTYGSGGIVGCGGVTITTTGTHLRTQAVSTGWTSSSITDATYTISVVTNPSYVQSQSVVCSTTSTCTITFANPVSSGDYIAVAFPGYSAPAATSVTDNCNTGGTSNSYTILDNSVTSGAGRAGQAVASIGANTASCSVTINLPSSAPYLFPAIEEISHTSGVDVHTAHNQTAPGAGTNAVTSTAVTTTHNNELILGWCGVGSINGANAISAGTGFTQRQVPSANAMLSEDLSQSTAGSIAATCTMTQGGAIYTLAGVMAFKP